MSHGLLVAGEYHLIPGVEIVSPGPGAPAWCKLDSRDYRARSRWIRQLVVHTTKGIWPQYVRAGAGAGNRDKIVAEFWRGDPQHSAAQIIIDNDGSVACLCDLARVEAYHATTCNPWSVGIEMYQEPDGGVHQAVYDTMVRLLPEIPRILGFAFQVPSRKYNGTIMRRLLNGGPDVVGVIGHRDNAWDFHKLTSTRGRGDPGDLIYALAIAAGAEALDYDRGEDLLLWRHRQAFLNAHHGEQLEIDGVAGPGTMRALARHGYANGRAIPA